MTEVEGWCWFLLHIIICHLQCEKLGGRGVSQVSYGPVLSNIYVNVTTLDTTGWSTDSRGVSYR